jgi:hypothetical protein
MRCSNKNKGILTFIITPILELIHTAQATHTTHATQPTHSSQITHATHTTHATKILQNIQK